MRDPLALPPEYAAREFRSTDLEAHPGYLDRMSIHVLDMRAYLAAMETGACYTVLKHGHPVGSGGVLLQHTGNGVAWFIPSPDVERHPRLHLQFARAMLETAEREFGLWRIEATCEADDARAANWLQHLGFEREGVKRSFLVPGRDHLAFARVRACPSLCSSLAA